MQIICFGFVEKLGGVEVIDHRRFAESIVLHDHARIIESHVDVRAYCRNYWHSEGAKISVA